MGDIKREELAKACKKIHKVRARVVAARMVRALVMSVETTANLQVRRPTWVRDGLRRYDEGGLEDPGIFSDAVDSRVTTWCTKRRL